MHLLLADDHALFRDGIRLLLMELDDQVTIHEADSLTTAVGAVRAYPDVDLALLDLNMPGMRGAEGVRAFRMQAREVPVVVISAADQASDIRAVLDAGAAGYVPKSSSAQVMLSALRLVLVGGVYVPPDLLRDVGQFMPSPVLPRLPGALTPQQTNVLRLIVQGKPNKVIARELRLSEGTVKIHLTAIFRALNVANRTEAAVVAQDMKLFT